MFQRNLKKTFDMAEHKQYYVENGGGKVWLMLADADITSTDTKVESIADPASGRGDIWPVLTPVTTDADGKGKIWAAGDTIEGFLIGATGINSEVAEPGNVYGRLQLFSATETLALVLTKGTVRYSDIYLPPTVDGVTPVNDQAALDTALLGSALREKGIDILGLQGVH